MPWGGAGGRCRVVVPVVGPSCPEAHVAAHAPPHSCMASALTPAHALRLVGGLHTWSAPPSSLKHCLLMPRPPPCSRIVWIDSKRVRVTPGKLRVIGRRGEVIAVVEHPMISSSGKCVTLNYYAAVNAILGPVAIKFVTGTTGLRRRYKVRTLQVECVAAVKAAGACPPPPNAPHPQLI